MARYELKRGTINTRPKHNDELQYALAKIDADPSKVVKHAARSKVIGEYMNREYNRLRSADMAGIRHKHYLNQLAEQKAYNDKIHNLKQRRLDMEEKQTNQAKKGALIGSLLSLAGIGMNSYHQRKMQLHDADLRDIQANIIETDSAALLKEGRLTPKQFDARMRAVEMLRKPSGGSGIDFGELMFWKGDKK